MEQLNDVLRCATAAVGELYFQFPIDGGDPIYRERVYCYELYHQMRNVWPEHSGFVLNGEVDKRSHPRLRELGIRYAIPDFLVHTPGSMQGNHAIVEVKSENAQPGGIRDDLIKLKLFTTTVGYQRAIYLFYGQPSISRIRNEAASIPELPAIELWLHQQPGVSAELVDVLHS